MEHKNFAIISILLLAIITLAGCLNPQLQQGNATITPTPAITPTPLPLQVQPSQTSSELKNFKSWEEVSLFLKSATQTSYYPYYSRGMMDAIPMMAAPEAKAGAAETSASDQAAPDYSTTNVQVEGVDEADILKNDGEYLYSVSNGQIAIIKAYPATEAKLVAVINDSNEQYTDIFISKNKLVAFGYKEYNWDPIIRPLEAEITQQTSPDQSPGGIVSKVAQAVAPIFSDLLPSRPYWYSQNAAFIKVFDTTDKSSPKELKKITVKGDYKDARLIGNKIYTFFTDSAYYGLPRPVYEVDGKTMDIQPSEIAYFDHPFDYYQFTIILGLDLENLNADAQRKIVLMGGAQELFVSQENAYVTYTSYNYYYPKWAAYQDAVFPSMPEEYKAKIAAVDETDLPDWRKDNLKISIANEFLQELSQSEETASTTLSQRLYDNLQQVEQKYQQERERTIIHKFSLGSKIDYEGKGSVPGRVLNQFSMDEYDGNFRIATTLGQVFRSNQGQTLSTNNLYVLDSSLKTIGNLENLAPGETIYSARFLGKRAYLVTFKKVDPLFAIGLDDPANPKLLGKLKIPGYSDYLHPYDETHLIGLGKDAVPAEEGDFAWYQGVKLALFDVSDVSTPKELATYTIGDRGTDSYALQDHKAFLFSKNKNLLVIPILLAKINKEKYPRGVEPSHYGDYEFQGAYIFNITLENGFQFRGAVGHANPEDFAKSGEYYYGWGGTDVKRSAYINNALYTVSDARIKANDLDTLKEQASIELPQPKRNYYGDIIIE